MGSAVNIFQHRKDSQQNTNTLSDLKRNKVLSSGMANTIGESGLCLAHLKVIVQRSGLDGLTHLLSETCKGKPRVTKNKKVIEKICEYLRNG